MSRTLASSFRAALLCAAAALCLVLAGCSKSGVTAPGGPVHTWLGLTPNPAPGESLSVALATVRATGVNMVVSPMPWSAFEVSPGVYRTSELRSLASLVRLLGGQIYVNLELIDTNQRTVPAELAGLAWDDTAMVARCDRAVDSLVSVATSQPLLAVGLGHQVDVYFSLHPDELAAFKTLYAREVNRIHARVAGMRVGIDALWAPTTTNPAGGAADQLAAASDLVIFSYFPLEPFDPSSSFLERPPSTWETDLAAMRARAAGKLWALEEVGYSSSPANGGSGALQADFVGRFRGTVAASSSAELLFANWIYYTDPADSTVNRLAAQYGIAAPGFRAFVAHLGLRDSTGAPKPAWNTWLHP